MKRDAIQQAPSFEASVKYSASKGAELKPLQYVEQIRLAGESGAKASSRATPFPASPEASGRLNTSLHVGRVDTLIDADSKLLVPESGSRAAGARLPIET